MMTLIEEDSIVVGRGVGPLGLIILPLDLKVRGLCIGRGEVHVLFGQTFFLMTNANLLGDFIHSPTDHLNKVRIRVAHLTLALKH